MKKLYLALTLVAMGLSATAQHVPPLDTMRGPDPSYFYPAHFWSHHLNGFCPFYMLGVDHDFFTGVAAGLYSDTTVRVVGIAVAARQAPRSDPKYKYRVLTLYNHGVDAPVPLASGLVDITTTLRWIEFENRDGQGYGPDFYGPTRTFTIPMQEVYFDDTIEVSDTFFVGISQTQDLMAEARNNFPEYTEVGQVMGYYPYYYDDSWMVLYPSWFSTDDNQWIYGPPGGTYYFIFPIIDTTGLYLHCAQFVCPGAEDVSVMQSSGIVMARWTADTLQNIRWQVSYGRRGTTPEHGRVLECNQTQTMLYNLMDSTHYVVYVRGLCSECNKWSEWSEGVEFYTGEEGIAQALPEESLTVKPNPARERFTVTSWAEMKELRVYDARGTMVERRTAGGTTAEVEVKGWPAGVYYVAVFTRSGVERRRIVVE